MTEQLLLTPADQGRPLTWQEFSTAGGQEGYHYELIQGKLDVSPLPKFSHDRLRDWVCESLRAYGKSHPRRLNHVQCPARVFVPDQTAKTAPEPDLAAYRNFPQDAPLDAVNWDDVSPILVAEILSPDSVAKDLRRNLKLYLLVPSIREYWVLDPRKSADRPKLTVYRRRGQRWQRALVVRPGGTYTSPRLLPGFSLVVDPHQ